MNIYEYQAKKILKKNGVTVPRGFIAYTPTEASEAASKISKNGPWVVKAQIQAGSRDLGKFADRRAGKKGGIRLSKTLNEVYKNADEMLENMLITSQTGAKGRLVSRVYVEEYIKTIKKFYIGYVIDRITASTMLLIAPVSDKTDNDIVRLATQNINNIFKMNIGQQKQIKNAQIEAITDFMGVKGIALKLKEFLNKTLKLFYQYDAILLEINPIGLTKSHDIWALDAKIILDKNALYKHQDILMLSNDAGIDERVMRAAKFGFEYKEMDSGIGIIVNGTGLALNVINEAKSQEMNTACFLNLKGGVDRDKISASIKLIMTNPKVDGIFINIIGGFSRCNLIADGIISVANDLGLNIPLVARFEGTNKEEAISILKTSGLPLQIADNTSSGLKMLKEAIKEDL